MRRSIKLIGVAAVFLVLAACSDDKNNDSLGACLVNMITLGYQQCTAPYDKATCESPYFNGNFIASCPEDFICEKTLEGLTVKFYGNSATIPCD